MKTGKKGNMFYLLICVSIFLWYAVGIIVIRLQRRLGDMLHMVSHDQPLHAMALIFLCFTFWPISKWIPSIYGSVGQKLNWKHF